MNQQTTQCSVCGRPLTSKESILRGMGPKCAGSVGVSVKKSPSILKPNYRFERHGEFLVILPNDKTDSGASLTNAMDVILYELEYLHKIDIFKLKIIYLDSGGFYDGIIPHEHGHDLTSMFYVKFDFLPIHSKNIDIAKAGYDVRRGNGR